MHPTVTSTCAHTCKHTCTHTSDDWRIRQEIHDHEHTCTCTYRHAHTCTHVHTHVHTYTHTYTHSLTVTHLSGLGSGVMKMSRWIKLSIETITLPDFADVRSLGSEAIRLSAPWMPSNCEDGCSATPLSLYTPATCSFVDEGKTSSNASLTASTLQGFCDVTNMSSPAYACTKRTISCEHNKDCPCPSIAMHFLTGERPGGIKCFPILVLNF